VEKVYAPIVVIALVALSILTGLVVKELKTLNALMQNFEVDRMKMRLKDLRQFGSSELPVEQDPGEMRIKRLLIFRILRDPNPRYGFAK